MIRNKLTFKENLFIGSMLFGLFFGAGNLIFPIHLGQTAGSNVWTANLGFLITAIGLPFLGIIAIGVSKTNGVFEISSRVSKIYGYLFTIGLYLVIGPFFALPRLATTTFEIAFSPFISPGTAKMVLPIFSILFFVIAWLFAHKPSKILDYIGKFLNPVFLILLGIVVLLAFIRPMDGIGHAPVSGDYSNSVLLKGFIDGYNTLDALASLAFGIIIVTTIKKLGVSNPNSIAKETLKSGTISIVAMGVIYTLLALMGTMSLGHFKVSENGGIALAQIAQHYLGDYGIIFLSLIIIVACLKTAIGLITAFSETFTELFPKSNYLWLATGVSILACIFANIGLTKIIMYSTPVLMFIYPLAITLILLALLSPLFNHSKIVYRFTTFFTLIAALVDGVKASPEYFVHTKFAQMIISLGEKYLPFFTIGMGWIIPALTGLVIGFIVYLVSSRKQSQVD
ncbi:branched-chain amino acid transport system II carrier protein [Staphylococcus saccharolyticus]|uniref:Branched-chain amino acid transport system carrier protein n=1 Tax=Staphylococcus saccharolyticus TaxID=33028 RepID=A0A380H090_9STAP|nr:branched-chain amino acid transport system II carrier protein [Staphylococcus saccharolyticus]MBL7564547.1 branched-chain amino acid transport system II carrier protein [Staphylococcus saccharolyticus]MBL7571189.1 branched-chain amino acid transport system II carrier protein [Staphylococcus saccharolyticus]QQB99029.1 branched-chain amino acid transport system II carrier protein [Staphylococcus saccharolyticus]QRJ66758.1 branched-chain amino acid transport system II carrier protein [Staphyloc